MHKVKLYPYLHRLQVAAGISCTCVAIAAGMQSDNMYPVKHVQRLISEGKLALATVSRLNRIICALDWTDGVRLAAGVEGTVHLHDAKSGRHIQTLHSYKVPVTAAGMLEGPTKRMTVSGKLRFAVY